MSVRILVIEDCEPVRRLICAAVNRREGFQIVGEAADGVEGLEKATELHPDVVLIDIGLPKLRGMEAARRLRGLVPSALIVFVTQEFSPVVMREAFLLGAQGYVIKSSIHEDLMRAIDAVLAGKQFASDPEQLRGIPSSTDRRSMDGDV